MDFIPRYPLNTIIDNMNRLLNPVTYSRPKSIQPRFQCFSTGFTFTFGPFQYTSPNEPPSGFQFFGQNKFGVFFSNLRYECVESRKEPALVTVAFQVAEKGFKLQYQGFQNL